MCMYNYWFYKEGNRSFGVFQLIGLELSAARDDGTEDGVEIRWANERKRTGLANIEILKISGEHIRSIPANLEKESAIWNLRDKDGKMCSSGVYITIVEAQRKEGKKRNKKIRFKIVRGDNLEKILKS